MSRDDWQDDRPDDFQDRRPDEFDDRWQDDFGDERERRPRKQMSTGMKVLIVLLILIGGSVAVCCGGMFLFFNRFQNAVTDDPDRIGQIRGEIAAIELGAEWRPRQGGDFDLFVMKMQMVAYSGRDELDGLMLLQMQVSGMSDADMERQFRTQARQQGSEEIRIESTETRSFTINGTECDFVFAKGTTEDGTAVRQVTGMFPGRKGMAFLVLTLSEESWDEAAVMRMIESIRK